MQTRSLIFMAAFYSAIVIQMVFWTPAFFFMKREDGWKVVRVWAWINLWLQNRIIGTRFDFRGLENIPRGEGVIVASKHQSTWETFTTLLFLEDPSYVLKRELMYIPLFGWFAFKMRMVPVNRGKRNKALKGLIREAKKQYDNNRQIIIYPEGTRRNAYAPPAYKYGITRMYQEMNANVLPLALNSGMFWPRRSLSHERGLIILEFLDIIEPGMSPKKFSATLEKRIEHKTAQLLAEGEKSKDTGNQFPGGSQSSR